MGMYITMMMHKTGIDLAQKHSSLHNTEHHPYCLLAETTDLAAAKPLVLVSGCQMDFVARPPA